MSRTAVISDIHANYHALCAVMEDAFDREHCTEVVCLGDVVGYNAYPRECLDYIRQIECPVVKGNHDEEVVSPSLAKMNPIAREAMEWTQRQLSEDQLQWLARLQYQRIVRPAGGTAASFTIVHSTLDQPKAWSYIVNANDASGSFTRQFSQLCFNGHTHVPKVYMWNGRASAEDYDAQHNLIMNGYTEVQPVPGYKYCINVGSVGQPRDNDPRASYAVYDSDSNLVIIKRVVYDVAAAQDAVLAAGLPGYLAERLGRGC
ncbi:MAG: metallophosphoesterase family protein [Akkermansia sp.]|nr:metallophosphoesterase family protein [Akkermansia sp.]